MLIKRFAALLAVALLAACAAPAGKSTEKSQDKPAARSNTTAADDDSSRVTCTQEAPTGSHLKKSACLSGAQREELRKQAETQLRRSGVSGGATQDPKIGL